MSVLPDEIVSKIVTTTRPSYPYLDSLKAANREIMRLSYCGNRLSGIQQWKRACYDVADGWYDELLPYQLNKDKIAQRQEEDYYLSLIEEGRYDDL